MIERWPPAKTLAYFEKAVEVRNMMNGGGAKAQDEFVGAGADDPMGFHM